MTGAYDAQEPRYPDGWSCDVEITPKRRRGALHGYCPDALADGRQVTLSMLGVTMSKIVKPGGFQIYLSVNLPQSHVALEIASYAQRMPTEPGDVREVSIVVDRMIFA